MDGEWLDASSQVSVKRMAISECHNHNGSSASYKLFSENVNGEVPTSAPDTSPHGEKLMIIADQTTKIHRVNDLGCGSDNISCVSKVDGIHLEIGGHDVADQKNVTGSSSSVNSFFEYGSERPTLIPSAKHGSLSSECISEEGNKFRGSQNAGEAHFVADMSDRSDPSEISSMREEHSGVVSTKVDSFSPARGSGLPPNSQKHIRECSEDSKADTAIDGNKKSVVVASKLDQQQSSETRTACGDLQEPPLQYCAINYNEVSDELVDVRICDICGDAGREYLLALCSKCNDGAEHIYCMRIKMDKVPDGDWVCEECMVTAEARKAEEQRIRGALQKSFTNEVAQRSKTLTPSGDSGRVRAAHDLASFRKRCRDDREVCHLTKKRVADNVVKIRSVPVSYGQRVLPRHANLKTMEKREALSLACSKSLGNIMWRDRQPSAGSLSKRKCSNSTDLRTVQESQDAYRKHKVAKGRQNSEAQPQNALARLGKSKSFAASTVATLDPSDSMKNMCNNFKVPIHGSKCSATQRSYSFNGMISQPVSPTGASSPSRLKPAKATPAPVQLKKQVAQTAEACRDLKKATVHHEANRQGNTNVSGLNKKIPCSVADKARTAGSSGRTSIACFEQKGDRQTAIMKAGLMSDDFKYQFNGKGDVQVHRLPPGRTLHLEVSAHPDVDCVWRGIFNVREWNKLPGCCPGLQAHLSTSASSKAYEVVRKFPSEMTVIEVLRRDIWPAHVQNDVTEDKIALYFFADDLESYQNYREFLNCMVSNDLALKSNLDGFELLIFPSHILPARSQRWNNHYFLWGVFRANKSSYPGDVCTPGSSEKIQIPSLDAVTSPKHLDAPIPHIYVPANATYSARAGQESCEADAHLGLVKTSEYSSQREPRSVVSTTCMEGSTVGEVDVNTTATAHMRKARHGGEGQTTNKAQEENKAQNEGPGEMHLPEINLNYPCNDSISLDSGPPGSGAAEMAELNLLELSLWPESKPANKGDLGLVLGLPNRNNFVSLDLSLALPPTDSGPVPMMEELLPENDDHVDTSLLLFHGFKRED